MPKDRKPNDEARQLLDSLLAFQTETGPKFSPQTLMAFIAVAAAPYGVTAGELARTVGVTQPGIARITADLGQTNRYGEPGLGLIEAVPDENEPRRHLYTLTDRGRQRMIQLLTPLYGPLESYPAVNASVRAAMSQRGRQLRQALKSRKTREPEAS